MDNYDIGILSFWNVPNYGTFAQAYALQKVIEYLGQKKDCRQIAYLNKKHFDCYYAWKPMCTPKYARFYSDLFKRTFPLSKYKRKQKMFLNNYQKIKHTKELDVAELSETKFNKIILGSDIIWDYTFKMFNNDPFLFGNGFKADSINSYAASFGTAKENDKLPQYVLEGLSRMDNISVRDKKSAKIVEHTIGKKPEIVLDPTYLWDFTKDENIVKPKYENYMVVYGQDFNEEQIRQIIEYAKSNKLMLICLDCNDDNYDWCDITIRQYKLTPFEWIGYFVHAENIATTTFHGLTFSIIFNKRFAFCKTQFIMDKAGDYLKSIGLYDLFNKENVTIEEMINHNWDYDYINSYLNKERKKSIAFIEKILNE